MNKIQFNEFNDDVKRLFAQRAGRFIDEILYFSANIEYIDNSKLFDNMEKEFLNVFELCYRDEFGDPDYDDCYMDLVGLTRDVIAENKRLFEDYQEKKNIEDFKLNKKNTRLKIKEFYIPKIVKCLVEDYGIKFKNFDMLNRVNDLNLEKNINKLNEDQKK